MLTMRPCLLALAVIMCATSWSSAPVLWAARAQQVVQLGDSPPTTSSDSDMQQTADYTQENVDAIVQSGQIQTARAMGNVTAGNEAKNATLMAEITDQYTTKVDQLELVKDGKRAGREAAITGLSALNDDLDTTIKADYDKKQNWTKATILQQKEAFSNSTALQRKQHYLACEQFKVKNPYPPDSPQFKAVSIACTGENRTSLEPTYTDDAAVYGPSMPTQGFTPKEQAESDKFEAELVVENAREASRVFNATRDAAREAAAVANLTNSSMRVHLL